MTALCTEAGIATTPVSGSLRLRRRGDLCFAINYGDTAVVAPAAENAGFILGGRSVPPRDLSIWRET